MLIVSHNKAFPFSTIRVRIRFTDSFRSANRIPSGFPNGKRLHILQLCVGRYVDVRSSVPSVLAVRSVFHL